MKKLFLVLVCSVFVTGCVSNKQVSVVKSTDRQMTCAQLGEEIDNLQVMLSDYEDDSGFTGKNVGMALLFWPGIFVNESRASDNIDSVRRRMDHLNGIRADNCGNNSSTATTAN